MVTGTSYLVSMKKVFLVEVNLSLKESKGLGSIDLRPPENHDHTFLFPYIPFVVCTSLSIEKALV